MGAMPELRILGRTRVLKGRPSRLLASLAAVTLLGVAGGTGGWAQAQEAPSFQLSPPHRAPLGSTVHVSSVDPCPPAPSGVVPSVTVEEVAGTAHAPHLKTASFPVAGDGSWAGDIAAFGQSSSQVGFSAQCPGQTSWMPPLGLTLGTVGAGYWLLLSHPTGLGDPVQPSHLAPIGDAFPIDFAGTPGIPSAAPIVGMAANPLTGVGQWVVDGNGGVYSFGDAPFFGSMGGRRLNRPVVGMAASPTGRGYWLVASDGGVFAFGDAVFFGSAGGLRLNRPVVGMAASPTGQGYWLVASDGGVFAFGDAVFFGSAGGLRLNRAVVGMAASPTGQGYWLVASDGGVFSFGDTAFFGSTGGRRLAAAVVGMAGSPDGKGYWIAAGDGSVFSFGDAPNSARPGPFPPYLAGGPAPAIVGIVGTPLTSPG
jgi:hypothetical protein